MTAVLNGVSLDSSKLTRLDVSAAPCEVGSPSLIIRRAGEYDEIYRPVGLTGERLQIPMFSNEIFWTKKHFLRFFA